MFWMMPKGTASMKQTQAERELLALLRGQDVAEFTLQISLVDRLSDRTGAVRQGWRLIENPIWTIVMSVPQVSGTRTTTSTESFTEAWQRQGLWWRRSIPKRLDVRSKDRNPTSADEIERAEALFLGIARGDGGRAIAMSVAVKAGRWTVKLQVPGTAGGATGEGPTFAYAWHHNWPWWHE
jgi:hypothetical protein